MKKTILTFCCLIIVMMAAAQKQANIWYFGNKAGLDFNQVPPVPLTNGKASSFEGTSVMSDNNGKLLFYTNGTVVMNRQHLLMKNGGNLGGHTSSTDNTLIVPLAGSDSIYYIFTTGAALQETHQFQYNIVNMKHDGGLGEVVTGNVLIEDLIFEKIAGVRHCNNRDTWIVVHKWNSDEYHAYLLTAAGLSAPVISHTGLVIDGGTTGNENNMIGTLKFSSKGTKLAAVHSFDNDAVELMDFDNTTGIISNPVVFHPNTTSHPPSFIGVYGAEFSPSGNLLYVSANNSNAIPSVLYQFDITSHNATTIMTTRQVLAQPTPWYGGALQLGPDYKIYMAMYEDDYVSVIDNPDVYGAGCNFVYNKIFIGPTGTKPVQFGLPNFIQSYFDTTANPYDFTRTAGKCTDHNISFSITRLSGIDSVKWDFGDASAQSRALNPTHFYTNPGFYNVRLVVYKVDCSGLNDTITRSIWITDQTSFLGPDTASCSSIQMPLGVTDISGANYLWSTGSVSNSITTTGPGLYWLEIQQNGCTIRDSVNISIKPSPVVNIGPDTSICFNHGIILNAGMIADSYLWNTGENTPSISIKDTGTYSVTVTVNSCSASDTLTVGWGECDIYIPTAFTPDNNGKNDYFGVLKGFSPKMFSLQVFNKAGQVVFSTTDVSQKWDGTYKRARQPFGAYVWILNYVNSKNERKFLSGTVMLIR